MSVRGGVGYVPGEWFAVLGERVVVLLPPSQKRRVVELWELVDAGAGFDEVLDALIAAGLRELPGFVLVTRSPAGVGGTRVVVRGDATVVATTPAGGETEVRGAEGTTWNERTLLHVTGLQIEAGVVPDDHPGHTLDVGLVRASRVTVPAASRAPSPPPAAAGDTTRAWPALEGRPSATPVATLVFSTGGEIAVDRVVLVGRAPEAGRLTGDDARLIKVPSPAKEISGTHLEVRPGTGPDQGCVVVTDLGSTNGTVVARPGQADEELRPGIGVGVGVGTVVDLGDGVTIRVTEP